MFSKREEKASQKAPEKILGPPRRRVSLLSSPVNDIQRCKEISRYQVGKVRFGLPAGSSISNHHCAAASRKKQNENLSEVRHTLKSTKESTWNAVLDTTLTLKRP